MSNEFSMVTTENANPAVMEDDNNFIMSLTAPKEACFCSVVAKTEDEKKILFKATNDPDHRIKEFVNKPIKVKDVFVEVVECTNRETGEVRKCPRIVLIDDKKVSYTAVSLGVFSALRKLFSIFGTPDTWEKPITVTPKTIEKDKYSILTLSM